MNSSSPTSQQSTSRTAHPPPSAGNIVANAAQQIRGGTATTTPGSPTKDTAGGAGGGIKPSNNRIMMIVGILLLLVLLVVSSSKMGFSTTPQSPSAADKPKLKSTETTGSSAGGGDPNRKKNSLSPPPSTPPSAKDDAALLEKMAQNAEKQVYKKDPLQAADNVFLQVNSNTNPSSAAAGGGAIPGKSDLSPAVAGASPSASGAVVQSPKRVDAPLAPSSPIEQPPHLSTGDVNDKKNTNNTVDQQQQQHHPSSDTYGLKDLMEENNRTLVRDFSTKTRGDILKLTFEPLSTRAATRRGTPYDEKQRDCARPSQAALGMYWSYEKKECRMMEGFATPMQSFEANEGELSCSEDSLYETTSTTKWVRLGFENFSNTTGVMDRFKIGKSWLVAVKEAFGRFKLGPRRKKQKQQQQSQTTASTADAAAAANSSSPTTTAAAAAATPAAVGPSTPAPPEMDLSGAAFGGAGASFPLQQGSDSPPASPTGNEWYYKTNVPIDIVLERRYSRFMFYTSWIFRQWLPWKPRPRFTLFRKRSGKASFRYRAWHDGGIENVYQIRNFCIHPNGGLSGLDPQAEAWRSYDDTRNKYHGEIEWRNYFKFVRGIQGTPIAFDERPTFFLPFMGLSRVNQAHTSLKFFAALGMLDFPLFGIGANDDVSDWKPKMKKKNKKQQQEEGNDDNEEEEEEEEDEFVPHSGTEHFNRGAKIKPLLILLWSKTPPHMNPVESDTKKTTAWGFFMRVLDLPYAVVDVRKDDERFVKRLYDLGKHSGGDIPRSATATAGSSSSSSSSNNTTVGGAAEGGADGIIKQRQRKRKATLAGGGVDMTGDLTVASPTAAAAAAAAANTAAAGDDHQSSLLSTKTNNNNNKRYVGGADVCFRRGIVWQACHFACGPGEEGNFEEASWSNFGKSFAKLNVWRLNTIRRYLSLLQNCLPLPRNKYIIGPGQLQSEHPYQLPFKQQYSSSSSSSSASEVASPSKTRNLMSYSPSIDVGIPKPANELPRVFFLLRTRTRGFMNLPLIADKIAALLKGFVSEVLFREPWRSSRAAFVDEMRTSDILVYSHGGSGAESVMMRPRPVVIEYQAGMFACGDNAGCWFEPMVASTGGAHHIFQLGQQPNSFYFLPPWMLADNIKDAVCRWYYMHPHRPVPSERIRLYCAKISGNSKYKSRHFVNLQASVNWPVDLADVQEMLRDNFGIALSHRAAVQLVEKLRSLARSKENGIERFMRSESPHLFRELFVRFVDPNLNRIGKVGSVMEQAELDGTKRRGIVLGNGQFMALEPLICLKANPNSSNYKQFEGQQQEEGAGAADETAAAAAAAAVPSNSNTNSSSKTTMTRVAVASDDGPTLPPRPVMRQRKSKRLCLYVGPNEVEEKEVREKF